MVDSGFYAQWVHTYLFCFSEHNQDANMLYVVMEKGDTDLATVFRKRNQHKDMLPQLLSAYWIDMLQAVKVLHEEGKNSEHDYPDQVLFSTQSAKIFTFSCSIWESWTFDPASQ